MPSILTIGDKNWRKYAAPPKIDGKKMSMGLIPRDFHKYPVGYLMCAKPFDLPLIDEDKWDAIIADQEANQSSLQHIRDKGCYGSPIPALDQNGQGYCWFYSGTAANMMVRAVNNQPYKRLSGHSGACIIKGYRDEGGWGPQGVEFQADIGVADVDHWPEKSMSRSNDTPAMRENMKLYRILEWMDCSDNAAERRKQVATALLLGLPVVADYNFWSHSVCLIRLMSKRKTRLLNSWTNEWSENGVGDLEDGKAFPDAAIVPRVIVAAAA